MSDTTDLVPFEQYSVASQNMSELAEVMALNLGDEISVRDMPSIKVPTGGAQKWTIPGFLDDEVTDHLDCVIVWHKNTRGYFPGPFTGGGTPPACRSSEGRFGEGEFERGSKLNPTGLCEKCPMSKFGSSDPSDPDSRPACTNRKAVFLMRADSLMPTVLSLPPTSIGNFRALMQRFTHGNRPYPSAIVRATLVKAQSKANIDYSQVEWAIKSVLEPEETAKMMELHVAIKDQFSDWIPVDDLAGEAPVDASADGAVGANA